MEFDFKTINYKEIEEKIVRFIKSIVKDKKIVLGLSGGIDSSVSCALATKAVGRKNVKAVIIKNTQFKKEGIDVARKYAKSLGVEVQEVDSEGIRDVFIKNIGVNNPDLILRATVDARICDLIIRTIAQVEERLYQGTINGTERLVGWYPKGALVGDFCPIGGILKHHLKSLADYLGLERLSEGVSEDASIVCGGCGELPDFKGISYLTLDTALYLYETIKPENFYQALSLNGITDFQWNKIYNRIQSVRHKDETFPQFPM